MPSADGQLKLHKRSLLMRQGTQQARPFPPLRLAEAAEGRLYRKSALTSSSESYYCCSQKEDQMNLDILLQITLTTTRKSQPASASASALVRRPEAITLVLPPWYFCGRGA